MLSLDVTVQAGEDRSRWFPHQMGRIRMKVKEFAFRQDVRDVVCLAFLNAGNVPVTPVPDTAMLPSYLKAWCETPGVEPGKGGGDLHSPLTRTSSVSRLMQIPDGFPEQLPVTCQGQPLYCAA